MIGIFTDLAVGGTFLAWSIHYLRGDDDYFLFDQNKTLDLVDNPLTDINSHNFIPNHPNRGADQGVDKLKRMLESLGDQGVVYFHMFDDLATTRDAAKVLFNTTDKQIVLSAKNYPLYFCRYQSRNGFIPGKEHHNSNADECYHYFVEKHFKNSAELWNSLELTDVWDQREFMALNFNPWHIPGVCAEQLASDYQNYHLVDIMEFYNLESSINEIFDYLELDIVPERLTHWQQIYKQWQKNHQSQLLFIWYFDRIINCIINGKYLNLERFNLDLQQEATIQHELIYKHNLNLKTWQLEKFTNTADLHTLLEPNTHNLNNSIAQATQ